MIVIFTIVFVLERNQTWVRRQGNLPLNIFKKNKNYPLVMGRTKYEKILL